MARDSSASERINILAVDDRPENLTALAAILDNPDYNVLLAGSGPEALKRLLESDVAVILLDVRMPGMDGFETARVVRHRDRTRGTPIIFLTADGEDVRLVDEAYAAGAVDYLVKPLDANVVRAKVAVFVELYRKAEQIRRQEEELRRIERRRSAAALAESEALYETTFHSAAIGIAHLSPDGRWLRANPRFLEIIAVRSSQVADLRLADVVVPEDLPSLTEEIGRVLAGAGESAHGEVLDCRFRQRGARDVWVKVTLSLLRDSAGKAKSVIVIVDDVTERRRAADGQRFLAEASELLIGSRDHVAALAAVARLAVPRIADVCVAEIAGEEAPLAVADTDEARAARIESRWRPFATMTRREPQLIADIEAEPPSCPLRGEGLASAVVVPLVARGRLLGAMTFAASPERRPFASPDLDLAEDLAHRAALAVDNARLFAQAQEAIRVRDEFLSIASHELRTPLTPLQLQLQRLLGARQKGLVETMPADKLRAVLVRCERQVMRLATLIDDLLDVSRISSGRLRLDLDGPVDLVELVREVSARHADELARAAAPFIVHAPEEPVTGTWDRRRLEQVLENLISNAVKYGAGTPIEISVEDSADQAALTVRDGGIGIPADKIARVFDRFERAVSARAYGGLGLGLYITRQIVEAHHGLIRVESEQGHGATFTVELPKLVPGQGTYGNATARP